MGVPEIVDPVGPLALGEAVPPPAATAQSDAGGDDKRVEVSHRDYEQAVDEASAALVCSPCASSDTKREDTISWDDYFMAVAKLSAMRSKDPSTQVGACIVDTEKRIVGIGYNGFPRGCSDEELPWGRSAASELDTKYPYVCHAEMNAIMNKNASSLRGCTIYVALFPCNECAKLILQSGITRVVYLSDKYRDMPFMKASRRMFDLAGIKQDLFVPSKSEIVLSLSS